MPQLTIHGRLNASLCTDCVVPLTGNTVVITRAESPQEFANTPLKSAFRQLSAKEASVRLGAALAQVEIGVDGGYSASWEDEAAKGHFDVAIRISRLDGAGATLEEPALFHLGTVEGDWQQSETGPSLSFDHGISARYWCALLEAWGWWVICGRVVDSNQEPQGGLTVTAFDRDWLQDDKLGQDITDTQGSFQIWYQASDFTPTVFSPLINLEMTSGPDVYFEVATSGGNKLIDETPVTGREVGRENVPHCFCETLVVDTAPVGYENPIFTHIGYFNIQSDFNADGTANGVKGGAGGAGWGFTGAFRLRGQCPKTHPVSGEPMSYRFLYVDPVTSAEKPVTGDMLVSDLLTSRKIPWDLNNDGTLEYAYQDLWLAGSGKTPVLPPGTGTAIPLHVIVPDADGWIEVDQEAIDDGFNGVLARVNSAKIVPGGAAPGSGAGNPPADPKTGATVTFIFETRTPGGPVLRQPQTVDVRLNNWAEVRELDLVEFQTGTDGACTGLTSTVTPKYTVQHEFLAAWSLGMSSAASPWTEPPLPSGAGPSPNPSVAATHAPIAVGSWPACSYTVSLSTRRALTTGESNDDPDSRLRTFCKT